MPEVCEEKRVKDFEVTRLGAIEQLPWKGLLSPLLLDRSESDVDLAVVTIHSLLSCYAWHDKPEGRAESLNPCKASLELTDPWEPIQGL